MLLEVNAHAAFQSLLEFFLDLAGFQHIDIKKIYPVIDVNFETIISFVQDAVTDEHKAYCSNIFITNNLIYLLYRIANIF